MSNGVIDQNDVQDWKNRLNKALEQKAWTSASAPNARPWANGLFGCFSPPTLCALTCCLPCVTFGKTHHRLRKNGNMEGYEPINTSCIAYFLSSYVCFAPILQAMQLQDIREKHNVEGSCGEDLLKSFCCLCCSLVQAEKESKDRVGEKAVTEQYSGERMVMGAQH